MAKEVTIGFNAQTCIQGVGSGIKPKETVSSVDLASVDDAEPLFIAGIEILKLGSVATKHSRGRVAKRTEFFLSPDARYIFWRRSGRRG